MLRVPRQKPRLPNPKAAMAQGLSENGKGLYWCQRTVAGLVRHDKGWLRHPKLNNFTWELAGAVYSLRIMVLRVNSRNNAA